MTRTRKTAGKARAMPRRKATKTTQTRRRTKPKGRKTVTKTKRTRRSKSTSVKKVSAIIQRFTKACEVAGRDLKLYRDGEAGSILSGQCGWDRPKEAPPSVRRRKKRKSPAKRRTPSKK